MGSGQAGRGDSGAATPRLPVVGAQATPLELFGTAPLALVSNSG